MFIISAYVILFILQGNNDLKQISFWHIIVNNFSKLLSVSSYFKHLLKLLSSTLSGFIYNIVVYSLISLPHPIITGLIISTLEFTDINLKNVFAIWITLCNNSWSEVLFTSNTITFFTSYGNGLSLPWIIVLKSIKSFWLNATILTVLRSILSSLIFSHSIGL